MDSQESNRREVTQFFGEVRDISPRDAPWGSFTSIVNLNGQVPGEIRTRKGTAPATTFTGTPTAYDIVSMFAYHSPLGPTVVTLDSNGDLKARRNSGSITIATGLSVAAPWNFVVTRDNKLIAVNGLQRGIIWYGTNSAGVELGVDAPTQTLTATLDSGGGASEGTYYIVYRHVDRDTQRTDYAYSEMSAVLEKDATEGQKFNYDLTTIDNPTGRGTHVEVWRSTVSENTAFYFIGVDDIASASNDLEDTNTDQALIDAAAEDANKVILLRGRYGVVMRRFSPPPTTKSAICLFKDRVWFGVDGVYSTGTVSVTNGDATLTGSGTAWTSEFVGRYVWIDGAATTYKIATFTSGTSLELTPTPAASLSGKAYKIVPDPAERNQVYYSALDEPESVHATFAITVQAVAGDQGETTALMPFGGVLTIFKERHAYNFNFSKEPNYDGDARFAFARGCINQRTWSILDGVAYVMDRDGAYALGPGGSVESISDVIQSYWRDGLIDFADSAWFFVDANPEDKTVRFFVNLTTDSATRPKRALCYHTVHKNWTVELWENEWAGVVRFDVDGVPKTIVGGKADRLYYLGSGELDGCSSATSGTATGGGNTTITDSGVSFGSSSELVGATVGLYDGTGYGGWRRITSHTNTQLTVDRAWDTNPAAGTKYLVGAVKYSAKTTFQPIVDQARKEEENKSVHLVVEPIATDLPMHVREYADFDASAMTFASDGDSPDRLVSWTSGSADREVSIHLGARTNDSGTGVNRGRVTLFSYGKSGGSRIQGRSEFAVEFDGFKGTEAIKIHNLAISGTGKS